MKYKITKTNTAPSMVFGASFRDINRRTSTDPRMPYRIHCRFRNARKWLHRNLRMSTRRALSGGTHPYRAFGYTPDCPLVTRKADTLRYTAFPSPEHPHTDTTDTRRKNHFQALEASHTCEFCSDWGKKSVFPSSGPRHPMQGFSSWSAFLQIAQSNPQGAIISLLIIREPPLTNRFQSFKLLYHHIIWLRYNKSYKILQKTWSRWKLWK